VADLEIDIDIRRQQEQADTELFEGKLRKLREAKDKVTRELIEVRRATAAQDSGTQRLQEDLARQRSENTELQARVADLDKTQKDLKAARDQIRQLSDKAASADLLETRLGVVTSEKTTLLATFAGLQGEVAAAREQAEKHRTDAEEAREQDARMQAEAEALRDDQARAEQVHKERLASESARWQAELEQLALEATGRETDIHQHLKEERTSLSREVDKLRQDVAARAQIEHALKETINRLTRENESLQQTRDTLRLEAAAARQEAEGHESTIELYRIQREALKSDMDHLRNEAEVLRSQRLALQTEGEVLRRELEARPLGGLADLHKDLEAAQHEAARWKAQAEARRAPSDELKALSDECTRLREESTFLREELERSLGTSRRDEQLEQELSTMREQRGALMKEAERLQMHLSQATARLDGVDDMRSRWQAETVRADGLQAQLATLHGHMRDVEEQRQAEPTSVDALKQQLMTVQQRLKDSEDERSRLTTDTGRIGALQVQLANLQSRLKESEEARERLRSDVTRLEAQRRRSEPGAPAAADGERMEELTRALRDKDRLLEDAYNEKMLLSQELDKEQKEKYDRVHMYERERRELTERVSDMMRQGEKDRQEREALILEINKMSSGKRKWPFG
ncbi:MAG TPA: hypothetical protein VGO93_16685, partial [Candidatus Xenobia bacterium]